MLSAFACSSGPLAHWERHGRRENWRVGGDEGNGHLHQREILKPKCLRYELYVFDSIVRSAVKVITTYKRSR